jgi:hypothetical protein
MIAAPVVFTAEEQALIAAYELLPADQQLSSYWTNVALDQLRSRVKKYYIQAQGTRCGYCNRHLATNNHRVWDIDHVVCRSKHPRFMFEAVNLIASCPDCNLRKGDHEVLVNAKRKTYPLESAAFRIVHPHFDAFQDHIHQLGMVYLPKTIKGKNTIYTCDLMRFAQKFIAWENSAADTSFEEEVDQVVQDEGQMSEVALNQILGKLKTN